MKFYMFRTVPLSIIRSSFTVHSTVVYVIQVCRQLSSRIKTELRSILILLESCLQTCMTYTTAECTVNELLMMERGTVRNMYNFMPKIKFAKLVHLVGLITKKFVTMHGHMNVKLFSQLLSPII